MKKPVIIIFLLLFSSELIKAQNISKAQPDSLIKIIPVGQDRQSDYLYTIGGKLQTREDVLLRLSRYAPSAYEVSKAKNNLTWTYISFGAGAVSATIATIEYATHNKNAGATAGFVDGQASIIYQHHSLAGAYIFTGLATAFLTSALIHLVNAGQHGEKAVKLYNQQYQ